MQIDSKLPNVGTTIFAVMSALAQENGAINLSQGFPDFDCDDMLKDLVYQAMKEGKNQYAPMAGVPVLLDRLSDKIKTLYGVQLDPAQEITVTAGATQAIFTALAALVRQGDEVILFEPAYDCYKPGIEAFGGIPKPVMLESPHFHIDWQKVYDLLSPKTRLIMINTPHNPTGTVLSRQDMQTLEKICSSRGILVLSDEVYEHIIFDDEEHQSVIRYPDLWQHALMCFSFGKLFHNTGWKVGFCAGPPHLMKEFRKMHQFNVFSVNTPVQYGLAGYLEDPETYLSLGELFQEKRDKFVSLMEGSHFRLLPCKGSYFILADYSQVSDLDDRSFARWLTVTHGVATIPLSPFYSIPNLDQRLVRICFGKTDPVLKGAADKLQAVGEHV